MTGRVSTIRASLLLLLLLSLWLNRCDSLTNNSLFYPFGTKAAGDSVVNTGNDNCSPAIQLPVSIFNHNAMFVSRMVTVAFGHFVSVPVCKPMTICKPCFTNLSSSSSSSSSSIKIEKT